jgi:HD-GYP domain-containing protein (c-di-GMP phosphodiesterase class II)
MAWILLSLVLVTGAALAAALVARRAIAAARGSRTDAATGCLDARGLEERVDAELALGARRGQAATLVLVELSAERRRASSLRWAAARLAECTRPGDALARLAGGEFALLLPATVKADARAVAARARSALSPRITAATGVAGYPEDGVDLGGLLDHARGELHPTRASEPSTPAEVPLSWATAFADAQNRRMTASHDHARLVGDHAAEIALRLGWQDEEIAMLRLAAVLHDIGKVALPDRVIAKPGPLTPAEFLQMSEHPVVGARMLARVEGLEMVADWVLRSHERFDGSGYPDGLAGERIPLASRILHAADAFDAMTSPRPHQHPLGLDEALAELRRHTGTQFDPVVILAFEAYVADARAPEGESPGGDEPHAA